MIVTLASASVYWFEEVLAPTEVSFKKITNRGTINGQNQRFAIFCI
jgi:hypothetical protein